MHILVATDASWTLDELRSALETTDTRFTVCSDGRDVAGAVKADPPDIAVLDLQVGSMGGMATTMSLRLDESSGLLPRVPVVMLLDRSVDIHLAKRSAADGWLIKPLDPLRIRRAVTTVIAGGTYTEGLPEAAAPDAPDAVDAPDAANAPEAGDGPSEPASGAESPTGESATTG